ncbi:MAG: aspartyl-tRNA(Asn)/glutamyl-tRNA(Gln) amidotransferase subunit C [Bacteroidia bacterium]|jgi:aspartyl-tRNA(Asn)/glutamyl-tRNA(Gln) amidotransferase subunit C
MEEHVIDQLAHLARLSFTMEEKAAIQGDLERILSFCEQLNQVDTVGVEPLVYINTHGIGLREDVVTSKLDKKRALKNAPKSDSDYFRVPKVVNK